METKCSICTGDPERLAEINALLAQQEPYKSIAMITGCSKSSIGRHAGEEQTQETVATLQRAR